MTKKLVLIDGNSIVNRAFYGLPDLTTTDGTHTNGVLGFLNILLKILEEEKPDYITVAFDVKHPTFRHEMYGEYKGTRKGMPDELREQIPLLKEMLDAMHIQRMEKPGYEADDILGTIAKQAEADGYVVSLVSGDRDLLQLADEKIKVRIPKTKRTGTEIEDYYTQDVIEKYGVTPAQIIDLKGLMGDASDNIPGVPGIGEKTAVKILTQFPTIEEAYAHVEEIMPKKAKESLKEHYDLAQLSKKLATIKTDCELDFSYERAEIGNLFTKEAYLLCKKLEFKSLLGRFSDVTDTQIEENEQLETNMVVMSAKKDLQLTGDYIGIACEYEETGLLAFAVATKEKAVFVPAKEENELLFADFLAGRTSKQILAGFDVKPWIGFFKQAEQTVQDLSVAAYLLNPLKDSYTYEDIARDYLKLPVSDKKTLFQAVYGTAGKQLTLFEDTSCEEKEAEQEARKKYLCYEALVAAKAAQVMLEQLREEGMADLYETMELPLVTTLYDMEKEGIAVHKEALHEYGEKLAVGIAALEKEIYEAAGETFNINSPKQLGVILFEKLKLPYAKKTKTGYSTSADILEKLRLEDPIVGKILEYRQLTKLKSTYADGLAAFIGADGRIHSKFNQMITATGRLSSTEPNLQNIPIRLELGRQIRKVFIPKPGYVFVDADYSQIELRILAHMSGDEQLIQAYKEAQDIHRITAAKVFNTPFEEVTDKQRSNAKAVNFGIVYGISSFGLGHNLDISRKEAEEYINQYFATYPRVKQYLDELVKNAKEQGFVTTLYGRKRPIPEITSSNFMQRSFGERIAMNSPIQGTAADIMKIAMNRVHDRLKKEQLQSRLILQIHDELLIEAKEEEVEQIKALLVEEMKQAAELSVPLEVDVKTGMNWYEAK